jgi:very-short-patch-repair endonuclease
VTPHLRANSLASLKFEKVVRAKVYIWDREKLLGEHFTTFPYFFFRRGENRFSRQVTPHLRANSLASLKFEKVVRAKVYIWDREKLLGEHFTTFPYFSFRRGEKRFSRQVTPHLRANSLASLKFEKVVRAKVYIWDREKLLGEHFTTFPYFSFRRGEKRFSRQVTPHLRANSLASLKFEKVVRAKVYIWDREKHLGEHFTTFPYFSFRRGEKRFYRQVTPHLRGNSLASLKFEKVVRAKVYIWDREKLLGELFTTSPYFFSRRGEKRFSLAGDASSEGQLPGLFEI